jgi:uncharacterized membrane protein
MSGRDRMLAAVTVVAGVAGFGIAIYLTVVHYSAVPLVCSATGLISCERVLSSPYSVIAGSTVPTSVAGIVWFAVSTLLGAAQLAGRDPARMIRLHLAWSAIGLATVIGLVFIEIVELGALCIWCTTAHALVIATFLAVLVRWQSLASSGATD